MAKPGSNPPIATGTIYIHVHVVTGGCRFDSLLSPTMIRLSQQLTQASFIQCLFMSVSGKMIIIIYIFPWPDHSFHFVRNINAPGIIQPASLPHHKSFWCQSDRTARVPICKCFRQKKGCSKRFCTLAKFTCTCTNAIKGIPTCLKLTSIPSANECTNNISSHINL